MRNSLTRLFAETDALVFALDPGRVIVFCNPALASWLDVIPEQILGQRCDYHSRDPHDAVSAALAALAVPPEVFQGTLVDGQIHRAVEGSLPVRRRVRYSALRTHEESWLLAVVEPVDLVGEEIAAEASSAPSDLHRRLLALRSQLQRRYRFDRILGDSPTARRIREQVRIAVDSRARTLVVGPPGSGREHLARTIHCGPASDATRRLLPLVCPLLDSELLEVALHSFLRQDTNTASLDDLAILLLDADLLPAETQETLLRLLASARRPVRTLATARQALPQLAVEGTYRADLAAWLSPLVIELPPLAARRSDLPLLAQLALEECNAAGERQFSGFQPDALDALTAYSWPDNIDELFVLVAAACRAATGPLIALQDLPDVLRRAAEPMRAERADEPLELDTILADVEREVLRRALRRSRGNKAQAARLLGLPRGRLLRRIDQLGLE